MIDDTYLVPELYLFLRNEFEEYHSDLFVHDEKLYHGEIFIGNLGTTTFEEFREIIEDIMHKKDFKKILARGNYNREIIWNSFRIMVSIELVEGN